MKQKVQIEDIKRHGPTIICGNGYTATEGYDGLETLVIKKDGRFWAEFRGSSLCFATPLSVDDKATIASLIND